VLFVDEVDSATNNQVFLDFLAQLRDGYISRDTDGVPTFQSVILAGVTDVKHLKRKIREEEVAKENSPWNIAADFTIDMSLSETGIKKMLDEYEADHRTGMDTAVIAKQIHDYTNGYPFLVSRICELIDKQLIPDTLDNLSGVWSTNGVEQAVKMIITEKNTLFDSLMGKIRDYDKFRMQMKYMLFRGETIDYLPDNKEQEQLMMYGFIVNNHNTVAVANKIFEMRLYRYFVGESSFAQEMRREALKNKPEFIKDGELNIPLIMDRFIESQKIIRNMNDEVAEKKFIEEEGRERFLTYISPIINGVGTYSVEERTSDLRRMDVVIHYNGKRYIIELKIWHGERYNAKGEKQIIGYLDFYGLTTGYMLSFNFNKSKKPGVEEVHIGDKVLYEGIV
ncbi:MAG: 9-O-acetyl-N-acetylneuraminate esterase, partial [Lachnospiraceae bacterium]|nr:9-O-acetyl-N-acetylneuraminate esterase [Lachnospiraceae bacterium]